MAIRSQLEEQKQDEGYDFEKLKSNITLDDKSLSQFQHWHSQLQGFDQILALKDKDLQQDALQELEQCLVPLRQFSLRNVMSDPVDASNCYLTIQAGAGGTEAQDFVEIITRMYRQWAGKDCKDVDLVQGDISGVRSVTLLMSQPFAYGWLKNEQGIHRFTRVSPHDSQQRRQTSFASVTVNPKANKQQMKEIILTPADYRVDVMRAQGNGGQNVQRTESAVRLVHHTTGIEVKCQQSRSQLENRVLALDILKSRLYTLQQYEKAQQQASKYASIRKQKMEFGSQVRSYSYSGFIGAKDSRTGVVKHDIEAVLNGDIDEFLEEALVQL